MRWVAFVDEAYDYVQAHGKEASIKEFMNTSGSFFRGGLYVFAPEQGRSRGLPAHRAREGGDQPLGREDSNGVYFVQEMIKTASVQGSGWIDYQYVNPAMGYQVQQKMSYVRKIDDQWLIGAGTYVLPQ